MCHQCDKTVIDMGILESDLAGLPFKRVYWYCMGTDCKCRIIIRDYGIAPIYYWPCKVLRRVNGHWRGGWTDYGHGYICSKHFKDYNRDPRAFVKAHDRNPQYMASRIVPVKAPGDSKPQTFSWRDYLLNRK